MAEMATARAGPFSRVMRSTPVRQALLLLVVFAAIGFLSLGAVFLKLRADVKETLEDELESEFASYDLTATPRALSAIVGARARATDPGAMVIVFLPENGRQVGNARAVLEGGALRILPMPDAPDLSPDGYVHDIKRLSGGVLVLGVSLTPLAALSDTFFSLIGLSLLPTGAISLAVAVLLARRGARRVDRIEATLDRLSAGDLSARVAAPPGSDDLARIAAGVDRLAEKQETATEALRQVSSDIAHDLKTPLQRVAVLLTELGERLDTGSETAGLAERARDEADRAVKVFQSMLQIAQIEGGTITRHFGPVDLGAVAERIVELYQPSIEEAQGEILFSACGAPVAMTGDDGLIGQALANLIENALRHGNAGSRISVRVGPGSSITVADNGPGIPEAEREKVTRRFYRLERSRSTPGQGLGLPLVAAVAQVHGGRLVLEDNAPGLRARIEFPPPEPRQP